MHNVAAIASRTVVRPSWLRREIIDWSPAFGATTSRTRWWARRSARAGPAARVREKRVGAADEQGSAGSRVRERTVRAGNAPRA